MELIFYVLASVYGEPQLLPSGARFQPYGLTAAHRTLPFGTCIRITSTADRSRSVNAIINDRGPCFSEQCKANTPHLLKRKLDLSLGTAMKLGYKDGVHQVEYKIVDKKECRDSN